jgi:histone acetyltransferase (RNA polymerase elongator complex component)
MLCKADNSLHAAQRRRPFIIPVFLPHRGCVHQCVFCNQHVITGAAPSLEPQRHLPEIIEQWLGYRRPGRGTAQVSFFGGNFLGLSRRSISACLAEVTRFIENRRVDGIRFSTRPDTINARSLALIADYPVHTVELGVQSMDDAVLERCRRGHTAAHTVSAVDRLKRSGYEIGLQLMLGLPGQDWPGLLKTARAVAALKPDFVRIYPTLVLAGSSLAAWYADGRYHPLELERALQWVKNLFLYFHGHGIAVTRMGLQASEGLADGRNLLAGPYHPAFGHLVYASLFYDMAIRLIERDGNRHRTVTLHVHPSCVPKIRGLKNRNIEGLREAFGLADIRILAEPGMACDSLVLNDGRCEMTFDQLEPSLQEDFS